MYKLTREGFPVALKYWSEQRAEIETPKFKQLLIFWCRLVDGGSKNLLNILSKIDAHDSYLFLLQKYSSDLASGVFSVDELLNNSEYEDVHEDLEYFRNLLSRKKEQEDFDLIPIVIINPSSSSEYSLQLQSRIFSEIRKFEFEGFALLEF